MLFKNKRRICKLTIKAIKSVKQNKGHLKMFFFQRPSCDIGTKYLQKKFFVKGLDVSQFAISVAPFYLNNPVFSHSKILRKNTFMEKAGINILASLN